MARLPQATSLFDSGIFIFAKEWKHLSSAIILLTLPLYLISLGMESNPKLYLPYLILTAIIGPLIYIITTVITQYRYQKEQTVHSKTLYQFIHDRFLPTIGTIACTSVLFFVSTILLVIPAGILKLIQLVSGADLVVSNALTSFGIVASIVMGLSALAIIVTVGVYVMFSIPITVLNKSWGIQAIKESITLVRGRWWSIFWRVFILELVAIVIALVVSIFGGVILGAGLMGSMITTILQEVAVIPISIAIIVLYLNASAKTTKPIVKTQSNKVTGAQKSKKTSRKVAKKAPAKKKAAHKKTVKKVTKRKVTKKK